MQSINLLAPDRKVRLHQEEMYEFIRNTTTSIWLSAMILLVILGLSWYIIDIQVLEKEGELNAQQIEAQAKQRVSLVTTIRNLNEELRTIERIEQTTVLWTPALWKIFEVVPPEIRLSEAKFDQSSKLALLRGHAATRDAFLDFTNRLGSIPAFTVVEVPLITQRTAIDFALQVKLDVAAFPNL